MTTATLTPNGSFDSGITNTGAANSYTALADSSDATYTTFTTADRVINNDYTSTTLAAGAVTKSFQLTIRASYPSSSGGNISVYVYTASGLLVQLTSIIAYPTAANFTLPAVPVSWTQTQIDSLYVRLIGPQVGAVVYRAYVTFTSAAQPTCAVSYPTGTPALSTSSFTALWSHTAGSDGGPQTYAQVKAFTAAQYGAGGFDATTSTADYDSGTIVGATGSHVVSGLANSTTYRCYVRTAQTVNGAQHWSAWDFEPFTTSFTTAVVASVTPVASNSAGTMTVTIARSSGTWASLELERSSGSTWVPVRGGTNVTTTNTFCTTFGASSVVIVDYECPASTSVTYRARATTSGGVVGAWVSSSSTSWTCSTVLLKDVHTPSLNVELLVSEMPQPTRSVTQGIFPIISSSYPVVVSDVRRARVGTFVGQTRSLATSQAFEAAIEYHAKLLQFPATSTWGARYIALADVQEMTFIGNKETGYRQWQIAYAEIDRPADETDY